jgi:hypothetical protein
MARAPAPNTPNTAATAAPPPKLIQTLETHLCIHVGPVHAQELDEVLVLEQNSLLDDLHIGLGLLELVQLGQHEVADLRDGQQPNCNSHAWRCWGVRSSLMLNVASAGAEHRGSCLQRARGRGSAGARRVGARERTIQERVAAPPWPRPGCAASPARPPRPCGPPSLRTGTGRALSRRGRGEARQAPPAQESCGRSHPPSLPRRPVGASMGRGRACAPESVLRAQRGRLLWAARCGTGRRSRHL